MQLPLIGLFALGYSGLVLFALAHALRRSYRPVRAAWTAFGLSVAMHGATPFLLAEPERWPALTLFWAAPHLLLLPLLLWSARKQSRP